MRTRRSPLSEWPARAWSMVTYSGEWPASQTAPATYRGYGEMYGGTPKFDGSSTYPSRITTFMGRNPCSGRDKRASPSLLLATPTADDDNQHDHHDRQHDRRDQPVRP